MMEFSIQGEYIQLDQLLKSAGIADSGGAAHALGLGGVIGNLAVGCEADFLLLDPKATPLLARKTAQANSLAELLFSLIVLGDDRLVERTVIAAA